MSDDVVDENGNGKDQRVYRVALTGGKLTERCLRYQRIEFTRLESGDRRLSTYMYTNRVCQRTIGVDFATRLILLSACKYITCTHF